MANPNVPETTHKDPKRDYQVPRAQNFDVVMLRKGVNQWEAKPDDYKRVPVVANSVTEAYGEAEVTAEKDFVAQQATAPGHRTEAELEALRRLQRPDTDKRKI